MGVEPTNAACAPSTATSHVLNHYTIEASRKKHAHVAYKTTADAAVHSVYGFYINYISVQNYDISRICSSDTCLFRPQWRHNPYKYFDFCGVEPTNAACAPSTATSDVLNHYTIEASPKKDAQVAYITTADAAVQSVYGFYITYFSVQNYDISLICSSDTCLLRPLYLYGLCLHSGRKRQVSLLQMRKIS